MQSKVSEQCNAPASTLAPALARGSRMGLLATLTLLASTALHAEVPLTEYQVKAGFIYNFAKLIQWPAATAGAAEAVSFCTFRDNPFAEATPGGSARSDAPTFRTATTAAELSGCRIAFIPDAQRASVGEVLQHTRGQPVLTIGETPGLGGQGLIINFYRAHENVRFEINVDAARRAGLTISSRLLNLARLIREPEALP